MTPDEPNSDPDLARDPLLRALSALPREDLDTWRSERLRTRAHAELAHARSHGSLERTGGALELLLMAACALLGLSRLVMVVTLIISASP
jgi:hypothetical protein